MSTGKPRCTATTMAVQHRQDEPHPMPPQVKMRELQHCIRNLPFYGRGLSVRIGTCKESCQAAKGAENNASFQIGDWASGVQSWHRESYKKRRPGIWTSQKGETLGRQNYNQGPAELTDRERRYAALLLRSVVSIFYISFASGGVLLRYYP
ncbi:hypothetical protein HDK77DRAFT_5488 [Phyllosticta capitalensis]